MFEGYIQQYSPSTSAFSRPRPLARKHNVYPIYITLHYAVRRKIKAVHLETSKEIERFVRTYTSKGLDPQKVQHWQKQIAQLQSDVRNHRDKIVAKVLEVKASVNSDAHDLEALA